MVVFTSSQKDFKKAALALVQNGGATADELQVLYAKCFAITNLNDYTKEALNRTDDFTKNDALAETVVATQQVLFDIINVLETIERYITLTVPVMADGGNYGVTVQLAGLKIVQDYRDKLEKCLEELSKFPSQRADALEKCKWLPSVSTSTAETATNSASTGDSATTGEESKTASTEENKKTTTTTQEKKSAAVTESPDAVYRKQAVVAVDVLYYTKARSAFSTALLAFMGVLDFTEKNAEKLAEPRGSTSSGGHYSSMY